MPQAIREYSDQQSDQARLYRAQESQMQRQVHGRRHAEVDETWIMAVRLRIGK
jgi:hypothetical protein